MCGELLSFDESECRPPDIDRLESLQLGGANFYQGASLDQRGWSLGPHLLGDRIQILLERVRPLAEVAFARRLPTWAQSQDSAFLPVVVGRTHRVHSAGYDTRQTR